MKNLKLLVSAFLEYLKLIDTYCMLNTLYILILSQTHKVGKNISMLQMRKTEAQLSN